MPSLADFLNTTKLPESRKNEILALNIAMDKISAEAVEPLRWPYALQNHLLRIYRETLLAD